jgi:hypothetical protein
MRKLYVRAVLDDGTVLNTTTRTADYMAYESEAKKPSRNWGGIADSPSTWEAYISYRALLRERLISEPFDQFLTHVAELDASSDEPDAEASEDGTETDGEVRPLKRGRTVAS